jgi:hypothetical protein
MDDETTVVHVSRMIMGYGRRCEIQPEFCSETIAPTKIVVCRMFVIYCVRVAGIRDFLLLLDRIRAKCWSILFTHREVWPRHILEGSVCVKYKNTSAYP